MAAETAARPRLLHPRRCPAHRGQGHRAPYDGRAPGPRGRLL